MISVTEGVAARNKALYGLAISVSFQEGESVQSEFYKIKEALEGWRHLRGQACGALTIEYIVEESGRREIEDFWAGKVESDASVRLVFASTGEVEISTLTPDGRNIRSIGFYLGGEQAI